MLSMCGLICRFFHGWRQSEAISLMRQIAIWPQATLLIEKFDYLDADETKAIYCQPLGGFVIKKQLIWRENSKQVITTTPKERIDLLNWTKFESEDSQTEGNNKLLPPLTYNCINEITVVLEASYKSIGKTPNNFISVSEVAELFAWRGKETFAVIIKTTPSRLVSMIQAFFNDSLFLEMNLQIYKMSTVETTGHPIVETIVANQTYTDNVKQIVHNLGNQIENASGNESGPAISLVEEDEASMSSGSTEIQRKPPHILIYTDDNLAYYQDVKETMLTAINHEKYVVNHLTNDMVYQLTWMTHSALLVICGDVTTHIDAVFIRHLLDGGNILSICSDFLKFAVPLYGNVEFAESSVVSLNYGKWKNVQLLHHKHCFHSSPKHGRNNNRKTGSSAVSVEPSLIEIKDEFGTFHKISLQVLATENTWAAPALLLADINGRSGRAVFSQVHLEKNLKAGISDSLPLCHLEESNNFRLEILKDLLASHFHLDVSGTKQKYALTPAYLIGDNQTELVNHFGSHASNKKLKRPPMKLCFITDATDVSPSENQLPIITGSSPYNFSVTQYLKTLKTKEIGRVAIYCDVITSTMNVLEGNSSIPNGLGVICSRQTKGKGRGGNDWISPVGCALMSVQLHIAKDSLLGKRLPFLQHIVSMAACFAVKQRPSYEWMPLRLKWPNDIYMGEHTKVGGVLVEASSEKDMNVANIGLGVNLDNSSPTTCINDEIRKRNKKDGTNLPMLDLETYTAEVFNCLEQLVKKFQEGGPDAILQMYYSIWLHTNAEIQVQKEHPFESATVIGVDEFGFLLAQFESGRVTNLHPDGNSFDMMEGLVYQK